MGKTTTVANVEFERYIQSSFRIQSGDTEQARLEFDVVYGYGVNVELGWDSPTNDQDLHMMHLAQSNVMCSEPWDCYFGNKEPQWFSTSPSGSGPNPRLDIDDVTGLGPENINIDSPVPGSYRVAIHYWGGSLATRNTVRIYLNGVQVGEYRRILRDEQAWLVADITWTAENLGYVVPYPSDTAGEVGAVSSFPTSQCSF